MRLPALATLASLTLLAGCAPDAMPTALPATATPAAMRRADSSNCAS